MVSQGRANRIAQRVRQELSELLLFQVTDPRLSGVSITYVKIDKELAFASIFVSCLEGTEREEEILEGLEHAAGFLRYQLSQRIQLRSFPQLRFNWDPAPEHAERIDELIQTWKDENKQED